MKFWKKKSAGFSLVELMVVVGIIGVLSAVAFPKYQKFTARAKQGEAQHNLSGIYQLEVVYQNDNNSYATMAQLGSFDYNAAPNKYAYTFSAAATTLTVNANHAGLCGGNGSADGWTLNETGTISHPVDGTTGC